MNPKGIAIIPDTNPSNPETNTKNIAQGIKRRIRKFTKTDTTDNTPVLCKIIGSTEMVAAIVEATISLVPKRIGKKVNQLIILGVTNKTPDVAIKDN